MLSLTSDNNKQLHLGQYFYTILQIMSVNLFDIALLHHLFTNIGYKVCAGLKEQIQTGYLYSIIIRAVVIIFVSGISK